MPYKDKNKQKEYQNKRYLANKKKYYESNKERRLLLFKKLFDYKKNLSCLYCGKRNPAYIDFHHNGDKLDTVGDVLRKTYSWDRVIEEIKKCDVVCANCHRKLHRKEKESQKYLENTTNLSQQHKRETYRWFCDYKSSLKCEICGEKESCCLDFHHTKDKTISVGRCASRGHSKKRILKEIEKCIVLCANCHRELHMDTCGCGEMQTH